MKTRKAFYSLCAAAVLALALAACGSKAEPVNNAAAANTGVTAAADTKAQTNADAAFGAKAAKTKTVKYLDKEYTVPAQTNRIVITGSMEAMEDALVLDVKPVGAITFVGAFPQRFAAITANAQSIGEKIEPNFEAILKLRPDVILGTTKFKPEVVEQLKKIAPLIQVSHVATNWEANLLLLGDLTGKQAEAQKQIAQYKADLDAAKAQLGEKLKDKKVLAVRVRAGQINIYSEPVFVNPILYGDLGLSVPAEVKGAKSQENISIEKLAEINPDYLFIQFATDENSDTPNILSDLQKNPILRNLKAFKNGNAFVNVIDPLAEGGPAWSRIAFLKAAIEKLNK